MASSGIKLSLAAVAVLLLAPVAALAEPSYESTPDEPVAYSKQRQRPYYKPAYKSAPVHSYYSWTGPYAGLFTGWGWGSSSWDSPAVTNKPTGMLFGATLGYNWQVTSFVYGVEGDIGWSGMKNSSGCGAFTCETKNQYLGTLRGRFGYSFDRLMPYMTAGLAIGDIKATSNNPGFPGGSGSKMGWTVGGGVEYALKSKWTMKLEYLYVNLGSIDCGGCGPVVPDKVSLNANVLRLGLNYKFGGGAHYDKW